MLEGIVQEEWPTIIWRRMEMERWKERKTDLIQSFLTQCVCGSRSMIDLKKIDFYLRRTPIQIVHSLHSSHIACYHNFLHTSVCYLGWTTGCVEGYLTTQHT